jgi:hypothetical protein
MEWISLKSCRKTRNKGFLAVLALLCLNGITFGQSNTVSDFLKSKAPDQSYYLYPTTLRMINVADDPEFDKLVKDIRRMRCLLYKTDRLPSTAYERIKRGVEQEGFGLMMEYTRQNRTVHFYVLENNSKPEGLIGLVQQPGELILIDVEGFADLRYLGKIINSGFSDFANLKLSTTN